MKTYILLICIVFFTNNLFAQTNISNAPDSKYQQAKLKSMDFLTATESELIYRLMFSRSCFQGPVPKIMIDKVEGIENHYSVFIVLETTGSILCTAAETIESVIITLPREKYEEATFYLE